MKKIIPVVVVALLLSACEIQPVKPELQAYKQVEYIVRVPPKEMITLPVKPANIDVDTSDQSVVADWLLKKEEYSRTVENMLISVGTFLVDEQSKLDDKAKTENAAAKDAAEKHDADSGARASEKKVDLKAKPSR